VAETKEEMKPIAAECMTVHRCGLDRRLHATAPLQRSGSAADLLSVRFPGGESQIGIRIIFSVSEN
jgi:hypothetical protein